MGKTGWIEKWRQGRVATILKVSYRALETREGRKLLAGPPYRETAREQMATLAEKSGLYQVVQRDLALGKMTLVGGQALAPGSLLEITIPLPRYQSQLRFLASLGPTESFMEMQQVLHRSGLLLLAVHREDMDHMEKHRGVEKLKEELRQGLQQMKERAESP